MFYAVLVKRGQSKADDLADALINARMEPASVYVIGVTDTEAFASALLGETLEVDSDLDARLAMKIKYSEAIGTEDRYNSLEHLLLLAKDRAGQLNRRNAYPDAGGFQCRR